MEDLEDILKKYSERVNVPLKDLTSTSRKYELSIARQVFWKVAKDTGFPPSILIRIFNRKNITIYKGVRHVEELKYSKDPYAMYCMYACNICFNR